MSIEANIRSLKETLPEGVTLIAVSKTRTLEEMELAYSVGVRDFAESKVQELVSKQSNFHSDVRWHFIGHLQRNKVKYIADKVFLIHSLDSVKLLMEVERQYEKNNIKAQVLVEVNIGREKSKSGILLEELGDILNEVEKCNFVEIVGLMTILPIGEEEENRKYFREMKAVFEMLSSVQYKNVNMKYLSMGMTGDYKEAVEEGSNMIRVGEGIFGRRLYNNNL